VADQRLASEAITRDHNRVYGEILVAGDGSYGVFKALTTAFDLPCNPTPDCTRSALQRCRIPGQHW
jgi:hypothetical protein